MTRILGIITLLFCICSCNEEYKEDGINYEAPPPINDREIGFDADSQYSFDAIEQIEYKDESSGEIAGTFSNAGYNLNLALNDITGNVSYAITSEGTASNLSPSSSLKAPASKASKQPRKKSKIIWTAGLEFQVTNVDSATRVIGDIAALNDGFISEMNKTQDNRRINNSITIKVNADNFQQTVNALKKLSIHLSSERINSQDVTKEYIDAESRLKTKQEVLERYKDILRTRTGKIEEVLEAEEKIRRLTEEIEAKKGYLRYLGDRVQFSRIQLNIFEKVEFATNEPVRYEETFVDKAKAGFGNGWEWIQNFLLLMITLWPLLLIVSVLLFWKRKWLKKNILR
ncbi:MAG: DUF4349 domain-containing protein [Bacteroidota bacterium]